MANIKSSAKRARQNIKRRALNRYYGTTARTYMKQVRSQIESNDFEQVDETLRLAVKMLDKAAQKGVIHRNKAARRKSRLMKALNKARAEQAAG